MILVQIPRVPYKHNPIPGKDITSWNYPVQFLYIYKVQDLLHSKSIFIRSILSLNRDEKEMTCNFTIWFNTILEY